jgi:hypothetical protein
MRLFAKTGARPRHAGHSDARRAGVFIKAS